MSSDPFAISGTVKLDVTNTTSRVQLSRATDQNCVVTAWPTNTGPVHIAFGNSNIEATLNDFPILPGSVNSFTISTSQSHVAGILEAGSGVIFVAVGQGA